MATGNSKTKWNDKDSLTGEAMISTGITLSYAGKSPASEVLSTPPFEAELLWSGDKTSPNRLYFGDNLSVLAGLLVDSDIKRKIKLIYIDPPFATNSVFHSRTQSDAYQDLLTGASYIEFLRKRLIILRELLADDGSIYVHLDDNMIFNIKVIMDEVFGQNNFRNCITRRKCSHKNSTKKSYGNISDYILFYSKSENYVWNRSFEEWTADRAIKEYSYIDEETGKRYKKVPIHAPGIRNGETGKPWRGMEPPPGKHWQYTPQVLESMDARGEIYWSATGNPRRKIYLENSEGVPVQDIWYDFRDDRNQNVLSTGYPTEKNPELLKRIIQASSNVGDIVLDCFAGSGSTLAMAGNLERTWIGVDNSLEAISTILRRFFKGVDRMGDYVPKKTEPEIQMSMLDLLNAQSVERQDDWQPIRNFSVFTDQKNYSKLQKIFQTISPG